MLARSESVQVIPPEVAHNLLLHGKEDPPQASDIIRIPNLSSVPHVSIAIPRTDGRPYAVFRTPIMEPSFTTDSETQNIDGIDEEIVLEQQVAVARPTFEFVLVTFSDPTNAAQNLKQSERGMQRTRMYGKLLELINRTEGRMRRRNATTYATTYESDGEKKIAQLDVNPRVLDVLRNVAFTFYADELAKEPLTQSLAEMEQKQAKIRTAEEMQKEDMLDAAKRVLADERFSKTGANLEYKEMVNETNKPPSENNGDGRKQETVVFSATKNDEADKKKPKTLIEEVEEFFKMDTPSASAGAYVQELWNRPF